MAASLPPLVVTGMHRSGTSMVSSWAAALGVNMGDRIVPADPANPKGYFEDIDFLDLNRRMLAACVPTDCAGGHPDWGWTECERFDPSPLPAFRERARSLVATRAADRPTWGWKDPRTTLLLDFWDSVAPPGGFRYLLLYRFPWDVADSMQRLGADVFLRYPGYAYRIWAFYNRRLLKFHEQNPDRTVLVSSNVLHMRPDLFPDLLGGPLGLTLPTREFRERPFGELFQTIGGDDPLIRLVALTSPQCFQILEELDRRAALPSTGLWKAGAPGAVRRREPKGPVNLSIVIPCFNQGELLVEAVASAERCGSEDSELIIVNDGSSEPRTLEVLGLLRSVGYVVHDQAHAGLSAARNTGFRLARGRFVLPLDDDNRLHPRFVELAVRLLSEDSSIDIVYGDRHEFGNRSGLIPVPDFDLDSLLLANYIDACAVFRKELWEACGGYDTSLPAWEDWDFWISLAKRDRRFHHLPGVAFDYRVRPGSLVTLCDREEVAGALFAHIIAKHSDLYGRRLTSMISLSRGREGELRSLLEAAHARWSTESARWMAERSAFIGEREANASELDRVVAARNSFQAERDRLAGQGIALIAEKETLREERDRAVCQAGTEFQERAALQKDRDELAAAYVALRERLAFMEGTRAWRTRDVVIRLKGLFR